MTDHPPERAATGNPAAAPLAKIARGRAVVFDGWISLSLVAVTICLIGVVGTVHTDEGPPLTSAWSVIFGCGFVFFTAITAASIAGSILGRTVLAAMEATLAASTPAEADPGDDEG